MEEVILNEIRFYLEALENTREQPIDIHDQLVQSISNVASHIVFGKRFDYNADQLSNLQFSEYFGDFFMTEFIPFLRVCVDFYGVKPVIFRLSGSTLLTMHFSQQYSIKTAKLLFGQ